MIISANVLELAKMLFFICSPCIDVKIVRHLTCEAKLHFDFQ